GAARLQQQDAVFAGFAEPAGDRAAGRTGAGHDEIESFCCACHNLPRPTSASAVPTLTKRMGVGKGGGPAIIRLCRFVAIASTYCPGSRQSRGIEEHPPAFAESVMLTR